MRGWRLILRPRQWTQPWRGGRVVDGSGLENRRRETFRGFESRPLRFDRVTETTDTDPRAPLQRGFSLVADLM